MKPLFTEIQQFRQWWIWLLIISTLSLPFFVFLKQMNTTENLVTYFVNNKSLWISSFVILLIIILFIVMKLETKITKETISFKFFPFLKRSYSFNEIETYKLIDYGFVGGWGIRFTMKYGTVYNTKGTKGLYIKLKNGKTFVIGTQKPIELEQTIKNINHG